MRVLVGHTNQMPELNARRPLPGREAKGDDILAFGNGYRQVHHAPGMAWESLLAQCPQGWKPDVYIHWSLEYNAIPDGLESADCFTVGVVGDWNLGGQAIRHAAGMFDALIADLNGAELLRRMGFANAHSAPLWAFDPALHRRLPGAPRDIDVLMIGNFNHAIQRERARWLARAAKLSRRHRALLTSGLFGEDYVRAMNRAKIVFNRSIRGEINMRAYEAPACGALLFYESENAEIRGLFTDREHCVLYTDANFEELLAWYLAPENVAERERIAEAGWRRVQAHTYAHHFAQLLDLLEPMAASHPQGSRASRRPFCRESSEAQRTRRAQQWLVSSDPRIFPKLETLLFPTTESVASAAGQQANTSERQSFSRPAGRSVSQGRGANRCSAVPCSGHRDGGFQPPDAERHRDGDFQSPVMANLRAATYGQWANGLSPGPERAFRFEQAIRHAQEAVEIAPGNLMARANLGFLCLASGRDGEGGTHLETAAAMLDPGDFAPGQLRGPCFPRRFEALDVEIERIWGQHAPETPEWTAGIRAALACRIHTTLAELAFQNNDLRAAETHAQAATEAQPDLGSAQLLLARALRRMGRLEAAMTACRRALVDSPFLLDAWAELAQMLMETGKAGEAATLLDECAAMLDGCPFYASLRAPLDALRARAKSQRAAAVQPAPMKFLAFPDWQDAAQWQQTVCAFALAYHANDPALLLLRADPQTDPPAAQLLRSLERFLVHDMRLPADALPNITLVNQPLAPTEESRLFQAADAVLLEGLSDARCERARQMQKPLLSLEAMATRQAA